MEGVFKSECTVMSMNSTVSSEMQVVSIENNALASLHVEMSLKAMLPLELGSVSSAERSGFFLLASGKEIRLCVEDFIGDKAIVGRGAGSG